MNELNKPEVKEVEQRNKKLGIKKVTLLDLDGAASNSVADECTCSTFCTSLCHTC